MASEAVAEGIFSQRISNGAKGGSGVVVEPTGKVRLGKKTQVIVKAIEWKRRKRLGKLTAFHPERSVVVYP